jgi:low affinity Fe/Cu permease
VNDITFLESYITPDGIAGITDVILGVAFLSLFIIQKSFNRFSVSLHLKVNELLASHEPAKNAMINIESKTEHEIIELSKDYAAMAREIIEENEKSQTT